MLELLIAKRTGIPIVIVEMTNSKVDVQAMREFVAQLSSKLEAQNRLDLVRQYVEDVSELQDVLYEIIDTLALRQRTNKGEALPQDQIDLPKWNSGAGHREMTSHAALVISR